MALSSIINRVVYQGNGSSAVFNYPYLFTNQTDLLVLGYVAGTGSSFQYNLNIDYSVAGQVNQSGYYPTGANIIFNTSIAQSTYITIARSPARVDNFQVTPTGPISSIALNNQMDYLTMLVQRLNDQISNCIQIPDAIPLMNNTLSSNVSPLLSPGYALGVNSSGMGWTLFQVPGAGAVLPVSLGGTGQTTVINAFNALSPMTTLGDMIAEGAGPSAVRIAGNSSLTGGTFFLTSTGTSGIAQLPVWQAFSLSLLTGVLAINQGGTGQTTAIGAFDALNPMTAAGDMIYAGSGVIATRLAGSTSGSSFFLTQNAIAGAPQAPAWGLASLSSLSPFPMTTLGDMVFAGSATSISRLAGSISNSTFFLSQTGSGGFAQAPVWQAISVPVGQITGTLPVSQGGTGQTAFGTGQILIGGGSSLINTLVYGPLGYALLGQGSSAPQWVNSLSLTGLTLGGPSFPGTQPNWNVFGATSGSITFIVQSSITTSYYWPWPVGPGAVGQVPTYQGGSSAMTWTSPLVNPMTTTGDMIVGGAAGSANRFAIGSTGQIVTSISGTATWSPPVTNNYFNGSLQLPSTNSWAATSSSFATPAATAGSSTLTTRQSNGLTLVATSNVAGVVFTPSSNSAAYYVHTQMLVVIGGAAGTTGAIEIIDNNNTVVGVSPLQAMTSAVGAQSIDVDGIYVPGTGSSVTLGFKVLTSTGAVNIGYGSGQASGFTGIEWQIFQIR